MGGASTNFGTVDVLKKMEDLDKYQRGLFPSSSTIGNRAAKLEAVANRYVPFEEYESDCGNPNIKFDYNSVLRLALKALGLWEKAKTRGVEIVFTLDYAQYCKTRGHVLAGAKIVDRDAINPKDGSLLMDDGENAQGNEELTCIPLHFVNAKESYDLFSTDLKPFFDFANQCLNNGIEMRNGDESTTAPFKLCAFPMDMSAEQKCLHSGGGCKVKELFCTKCACRSSKLHYFWDKHHTKPTCAICEEVWNGGREGGGDAPVRCWHYPVDDTQEISRKKGTLSSLLAEHELHLEESSAVKSGSKILYDPSLEGKEKNMMHVDYEYTGVAPQERNTFGKLVDTEFKLRGWSKMFKDGSGIHPIALVDKITKLKQSMLEGAIVIQLRDSIEHNGSVVGDFLFAQSLAIPCILHMENRVNEKIIMMVILEGMRKRSSPAALSEYFDSLVHLFNNGVMHDKDGQWKLPMKNDKLDPISLSNVSARKVVKRIELLFDLVFAQHPQECQRRNMFKVCITEQFQALMESVRQRTDFTDNDIIKLQRKIDIFYDSWYDLCGKDGLTNYIHLLGSGHVMYYLKKYRNLYRFSNQAWERLNNRLKMFYLQKTQRGGSGKYPSKIGSSHTRPMARWMQRILMWNTSLGERYFSGEELGTW